MIDFKQWIAASFQIDEKFEDLLNQVQKSWPENCDLIFYQAGSSRFHCTMEQPAVPLNLVLACSAAAVGNSNHIFSFNEVSRKEKRLEPRPGGCTIKLYSFLFQGKVETQNDKAY